MRLPKEAEILELVNELKRTLTTFGQRGLLWLIYLSLLAVLLPHTAWWFSKSQKPGMEFLAWLLAFVFEASVFGFTHNLVERIEASHRLRKRESEYIFLFWLRRFSKAYLNLNSFGLLTVSLVSALANFSYSVEFAQPFKVYAEYSIDPLIYHLAAGGILPFVGLMFANILARLEPTEDGPTEAEQRAKEAERLAKRELQAAKAELETAKGELWAAKQQFSKVENLFAEDKRLRILAASQLWPEASGSAIAQVSGTSPAYVSEVLSNGRVK